MASGTALRSLVTPAVPGSLDALHELLDLLWLDVPDVTVRERHGFTTAVAEVAANIVEHAAAGQDVSMHVVLHAQPTRVEALLEDRGTPYDGVATSDGGDPEAESGRGLALARALVDEVTYERDGPVNRWLVVMGRATT